jgi:hypothetical protein
MTFPTLTTEFRNELSFIESRNGGVVVEVCSYCPKDKSEELKSLGFAWDKVARVLLRVDVSDSATLEDLLATEALRCEFFTQPCHRAELSLRSFASAATFSAVSSIMRDRGARYDRAQRRWTLDLDRESRKELQAVVASQSGERAKKEETEQKLTNAMETKMECCQSSYEKRQREWDTLQAQDSSFMRRDYEYTQRLKLMLKYNDFEVGSDGSPNWPDPPVPQGFSRY